MLGDFVAQVRHGVVPVWIGQSEFAYNGAVSPLRLAPWFQHMGGLLDLAAAQRLEPTALKNALLCVNAFAVAGSAYFCLRAILVRRPGLACALALLWLASPGVLAPIYFGDQYMTFMAMPFIPPLLLGCWRLWAKDYAGARLLIVLGAAGLWLSHTPIALWGSLLAAGMCVARLLARGNWLAEGRRLAWMIALFAVLGAFPVGSALTIDHPVTMTTVGAQVPSEIAGAFPGNFMPIDRDHPGTEGYQLGYALLAVGVAALGLLAWLRPPGAAPFAIALLLVAPLTLPVPWLTSWFWLHAPRLLVSIDNIWPMQRLFTLWTILIVFAFAIAAAQPQISAHPRRVVLLLAALAVSGIWSAFEATRFMQAIDYTMPGQAETEVLLRPENMRLTRYPYASFSTVPAYASHGYVDPGLENRLLDRRTRELLKANADVAAPPSGETPISGQLVQSGLWRATSFRQNKIYGLSPEIRLEPGRHYALRLDFSHLDRHGVLQILSPGMFREYILPDSGGGLGSDGPPLSLGSLPTSGHVIPLLHHDPGPDTPILQFVMPKYQEDAFDFARFNLYEYDPEKLPIRVTSWIPYKADLETPVAAFLETPRVWQSGWRAKVNGQAVAVEASPQHLAMVPVEAGHNRVILTFQPPVWLNAWYWMAVAGWAVVLAVGARRVVRFAFPPAPRDIRV